MSTPIKALANKIGDELRKAFVGSGIFRQFDVSLGVFNHERMLIALVDEAYLVKNISHVRIGIIIPFSANMGRFEYDPRSCAPRSDAEIRKQVDDSPECKRILDCIASIPELDKKDTFVTVDGSKYYLAMHKEAMLHHRPELIETEKIIPCGDFVPDKNHPADD